MSDNKFSVGQHVLVNPAKILTNRGWRGEVVAIDGEMVSVKFFGGPSVRYHFTDLIRRRKPNRIKRRDLDAQFEVLKRGTIEHNDDNDCTVIATAVAAGVSYAVAHAKLKELGRKDKRGFYSYQYHKAIRQLGNKELREVNPRHFLDRYPNGAAFRNVTTHQVDRYPKVWTDGRTYLMNVRGHVAAIVNGRIIDWSRNKALRAQTIYEVVEKGAPLEAHQHRDFNA